MTRSRELDSLKSYAKLVLALTAAALLLAAVGFTPTVRLAGDDARTAMLVAIAISWFACAVAALPLVGMSSAASPHLRLTLSTGLRFLLLVVLTVPVVMSAWFDNAPFLIWIGISYFFLLMIDAVFAVAKLGVFGTGAGETAAGKLAGNR